MPTTNTPSESGHLRYGGHAGGHLRSAVEDLVQSGELAEDADHNGTPLTPERLLALLAECTDIMPNLLCGNLNLSAGSTYADGVRVPANEE